MNTTSPWQRTIAISTAFLAVIAAGIVVHNLGGILIPFILAGFISIVFNPFVRKMRSKHIPTAVAILMVMIIAGGSLWLVSIILSLGVNSFVENSAFYSHQLKVVIADVERSMGYVLRSVGTKGSIKLASIVTSEAIISFATSQVSTILGLVGDSVMILLFLLFMLAASEAFPSKILVAFDEHSGAKVLSTFETLSTKVRRYLVMKTLFALTNGIIAWLVLSAFGVDFAPLFGLLTFMFQYIPNIGSMISTTIPATVFLLQTGSIGSAGALALTLTVIQNLLGNLVEPKVIGDQLRLSPVVVLFALVFWGWMWGIVGMVLSIPIMSFCKVLLEIFPSTRPIAVLMGSAVGTKPVPEMAKH